MNTASAVKQLLADRQSSWVVKGRPDRNPLEEILRPGRRQRWVTRKPPVAWAVGDLAFMWVSSPGLVVCGLAEITELEDADRAGDTHFHLRYLTEFLDDPISAKQLRADPVVGSTSFLKAGPAGTLFPLTPPQAERLATLVLDANPGLELPAPCSPKRVPADQPAPPVRRGPVPASQPKPPSPRRPASPEADAWMPDIALSIRQPWAELILRGVKKEEYRSVPTHKKCRVLIYASLTCGPNEEEELARLGEEFPKGVIVGSVEIVGCEQLDDGSYAWQLARPIRAKTLRAPELHAQPAFFRPFRSSSRPPAVNAR